MKTEVIQTLTTMFEAHAQKVERRMASEEKRSLKNPDGLSEPTEE